MTQLKASQLVSPTSDNNNSCNHVVKHWLSICHNRQNKKETNNLMTSYYVDVLTIESLY